MNIVKGGQKGSERTIRPCWCMEGYPYLDAQFQGFLVNGCSCGCGPTTADFAASMAYHPPPDP